MLIEQLKNIIENKTNRKIRKGFDKFIIKTIEYFSLNFNNLSLDDCECILNFVNASNSKCHKSYWILRCNLSDEESINKATTYSQKFINSSYKYNERSVVSKKHCNENKARGYCGYVNINGIECYCRSKSEYILWNLLHEEYGIENIKYECCTFNIENEFNYKPDFFIYKNSELIKIVECKSQFFECTDRYKLIKNFFEKLKIDYEIVIDPIKFANIELKNKLKEWINSNRVIKSFCRENNSMYGVKHKQSTKDKISKKAKDRCEKREYIQKLKDAQDRHFSKLNGVGISVLDNKTGIVYYTKTSLIKNTDVNNSKFNNLVKSGRLVILKKSARELKKYDSNKSKNS